METTNDSVPFIKAGEITTNAQGVAQVVFDNPYTSDVTYHVSVSWQDPGQSVVAYASNTTANGFTITTKDTKQGGGAYNVVGGVTVDWIAVPTWS